MKISIKQLGSETIDTQIMSFIPTRNRMRVLSNTQMYMVDFEISPRRKSVTIGHVYLLQDKFDTQGKLLFQDENQVLFKTIEDKIEEWIYE